MLLVACDAGTAPVASDGASDAPAGARFVARDAVDAAQLPQAILAECHAPLMHRMQRVKATVSLEDGRKLLVQARLPSLGRVREGKQEWLVAQGRVEALGGGEVSAAQAAALRDALAVVDAAAFGPIHRASRCRAVGADFALGDGAREVTVTLHPNTLLPAAIAAAGATVTIEDYLRTPTSWVARALRHPRLGSCRVVFEDGGLLFPPDYFEGKQSPRATKESVRAPIPGAAIETQSSTPIIVAGKATQLVLLADPGAWRPRHDRYRDVIAELQRQDQRIAGFPLLFTDARGQRRVAAPFRRRPKGAAFAAPDDYELSAIPEGKLLVVYPKEGDLDARVATGRRLLERALTNRKLQARGPIIAQPFLQLQTTPPDATKLEDVVVRVWVRIE